MKKIAIVAITAVAIAILTPVVSNADVTRDKVKSELLKIEKTGYYPGSNDENYPIEMLNAQAAMSDTTSIMVDAYGADVAGKTQAGAPAKSK